jgi:hypothetical protein
VSRASKVLIDVSVNQVGKKCASINNYGPQAGRS